jgi:predicted ATP-dependent serine protease
MWTCPACGTRNAMDAAECTACGRWASIFDLERGTDDEGAARYAAPAARTPEPEPVVIAEPHSSTAERARRVFDVFGESGDGEAGGDVEQRRTGNLIRWIFVGLAVFWFVLVPLVDQLR